MLIQKHHLELGARLHVFLMLNLYGIGKLMGGQFYRRGNLPEELATTPLAEVGSFDLAWAFMGYSYTYILFVGITQLLGAWCLLWDKTKLLGVAILLPIMVNIVLFDAIFFEAGSYGALGSASLYLLQLLFILWLNRTTVLKLWHQIIHPLAMDTPSSKSLTRWLIALTLVALFFALDQLIVNLLGY